MIRSTEACKQKAIESSKNVEICQKLPICQTNTPGSSTGILIWFCLTIGLSVKNIYMYVKDLNWAWHQAKPNEFAYCTRSALVLMTIKFTYIEVNRLVECCNNMEYWGRHIVYYVYLLYNISSQQVETVGNL